jgi:aspartate kinase
MKVCKFGGTSLATAESVAKVCDIVISDPERKIIVVSAPGKRNSEDTKVTDLLIQAALWRLSYKGKDTFDAIVARFAEIQKGLGLSDSITQEISQNIKACLDSDTTYKEKYLDRVKAAGEDNCARLVAEALRQRGVNAIYMSPCTAGLILTSEYGNARILPESYENLAELKKRKEIIVFPGFFGRSPEGDVVTFPRGGSDITGSILAASVEAEEYENFTDVSSIYAADPKIVPEAKPIKELTYREVRELSYSGFSVFHEEAIIPIVHKKIPVRVRNTYQPDEPGTLIVPERKYTRGEIAGIAARAGFCTVYLSKYLMNREIGFGRRLLQIFEEEGLGFEHMPSGIDNISVVLKEEDLDKETEATILRRIKEELLVDDVYVERGLALIMIAGEGMRYTVGLAAKATAALAEANVNIEMLDQGASEISMMFGVKAEDMAKAVRHLYRAFFGNQ